MAVGARLTRKNQLMKTQSLITCFTLAASLALGCTPGDDAVTGTDENNISGIPETCPDPADDAVHYVSSDPAACLAAFIGCDEGETSFNNDCGCGCIGEPADPACQDPGDPAVTLYIEGVSACAAALFQCEEQETMFHDDCGCGCIADDPASACADPADPDIVWYIDDPLTCAAILYSCEPNEQPFSDACGCGCELQD